MAADADLAPDASIVELPSSPEDLVIAADFPDFTPSRLFRYWIEADLITRWWPQEAGFDARPGGSYRLSWPTMNWHLYGTYSVFEPDTNLGFTWQWEHTPEAAPSMVRLRFEAIDGGTRLTLTHGPHADDEEGRAARQGHLEGWMHFLPKLQALAATEVGEMA
jgi:uncharacterized protein YndB with AHSA1/START domain